MPRKCSKSHGSFNFIRFDTVRYTIFAYLFSDGIDSEAIAHIYADAEFKPPPKRRRIEDSQTSRTGNTFGNAPGYSINIGSFAREYGA
jgi:hypothetical protein